MHKDLFFCHFAGDPFFNMAFDEWMLSSVFSSPGSTLLRLYTWRVGAITIGYHQGLERAVNTANLGDTPVIRRVTGGRAVYHDPSELTYAIAVNPLVPDSDDARANSIAAAHRRFALALSVFLKELDIDTVVAERSTVSGNRSRRHHKEPCFSSVARCELLHQGRKIVASAQRQIRGVILQHGSIKLSGVVSHPALTVSHTDGSKPQPIGREQLDMLAHLFLRSMTKALGVTLKPGLVSSRVDSIVRFHTDVIERYPLSRRFSVEQDAPPGSLISEKTSV
ncbi:MAG: hypothetical protein DRP45_00320 [Candidatus Zixiibacteriota bacterium]|nr:MAG: hypothetical protein DRP45_00320 [candidate division Zixibacteria bacterium]